MMLKLLRSSFFTLNIFEKDLINCTLNLDKLHVKHKTRKFVPRGTLDNYRPIYTKSTEISLGDTPEILDA